MSITLPVAWYEKESRETFLRSVRRNPGAHFSLHIEAVRVSKTGHLSPGYHTLQYLVDDGTICINGNMVELTSSTA